MVLSGHGDKPWENIFQCLSTRCSSRIFNRVPRSRKTSKPTTHAEAIDEVVAVLQANSEATDAEICDLINRWLSRRASDLTLTVDEIARKRVELKIPPTDRRPFQKNLFEP